jgi:hypothetical protein
VIPIAAGIAIVRYRLYDIDRLINRTLVYGLHTSLLGTVYVGIVLSLGQLFDAAKTIDAFNARLRDEVDLDTLSPELVAVVDQTMEPTAVSLRLRGPMERSGRPLG